MISYGRWGKYHGMKIFFTHRNPKTGEVWNEKYEVWVPSDRVTWL